MLINVYTASLNRKMLKKCKPGDTIRLETTVPCGLKMTVSVLDITETTITGTTPYATTGDVNCHLLIGKTGHTTIVLYDD